MELPSQKAFVLETLHRQGLFLTVHNIKRFGKLIWFAEPRPYVVASMTNLLEQFTGSLAIEEPETGYFFTMKWVEASRAWFVAHAPAKGGPRPISFTIGDDKLSQSLTDWALAVVSEVGAAKPWGGRFPAGSIVLTLGKTAALHDQLVQCGLDLGNLQIKVTNSGTNIRIMLPNNEYFFQFQRKWSWKYQPAEFRLEAGGSGTWNDLLAAIPMWVSFVRKQEGVRFPQPPAPVQRDRQSLKVTSLELVNIRRFRHLKLSFVNDVNVFCGRNGTGKSTILRCLVIALCHEVDTPALVADVPGGLLAQGMSGGKIAATVRFADGSEENVLVILARKDDRDFVTEQSKPFKHEEPLVCGYGSMFRSAAQAEQGDYKMRDTTTSLFVEEARLLGLETVLHRLAAFWPTEAHDEKIKELCQALGLKGTVSLRPGGGVAVTEGDSTFTFEGLADGYRIGLSWLVDYFGWALSAKVLTNDSPAGIVLCDEVDKHMHPAIQAKLVEGLVGVLPASQLFLTTHNPLTVMGTAPSTLHVLSEEAGAVTSHRPPDFEGYSVEDIYTHPELFDTDPFSPAVRRLLTEHQELAKIGREQRSVEETARLRALALQLRELPTRD